MNALRDDINPRFVHFTRVASADADVAALVDEAIADYDPADGPVVREAEIETLQPLRPGAVRVDLWVEHIDNRECTYGFLCSSADGTVPYARGARIVTKLGRWSDRFIRRQTALLKDLPAFA